MSEVPLSISVALCTFNGQRFLAEQLQSIAAQSVVPYELVVCDDGSTDATPQLIERFATSVNFPVRSFINSQNLRSTKNFEKAITLCQGNVIALADQDDVWLPKKLATLQQSLREHPDAGYVFSDAEVVDENLTSLGYTLWESIGFTAATQRRVAHGDSFAEQLRRYFVTGATMAFRAEFRDLVLPIPADWVHDAWIAMCISAVANCCLVNEPLIQYRQHGSQQIGAQKRSLYEKYRFAKQRTRASFQTLADNYQIAADRLGALGRLSPRNRELLAQKTRHHQNQYHMREPGKWRWPSVAREWFSGRYSKYSRGLLEAAADLFLP